MASPWDFYFEHLAAECQRNFLAWCQHGDYISGFYLHLFTADEFGDGDED